MKFYVFYNSYLKTRKRKTEPANPSEDVLANKPLCLQVKLHDTKLLQFVLVDVKYPNWWWLMVCYAPTRSYQYTYRSTSIIANYFDMKTLTWRHYKTWRKEVSNHNLILAQMTNQNRPWGRIHQHRFRLLMYPDTPKSPRSNTASPKRILHSKRNTDQVIEFS